MNRVLIVDDEKPARIAIGKLGMWNKYGFEQPQYAENGTQAVSAMREIHPDLVFVDMQMPVMDGTEFLKTASAEFPGTVFVVISGYDDFHYAQSAIRYGATDYLLKPIVEEDLNHVIEKACMKLHPEKKLPEQVPSDNASVDVSGVIEIIRERIEKNYGSNLKIGDFSDRYFFSREYLSKLFRIRYGYGIYEYLLKVRMERARELLSSSDIRIQEIARRVGYTDNNYFSKAFRNYWHISPSEFRKKLTEQKP